MNTPRVTIPVTDMSKCLRALADKKPHCVTCHLSWTYSFNRARINAKTDRAASRARVPHPTDYTAQYTSHTGSEPHRAILLSTSTSQTPE